MKLKNEAILLRHKVLALSYNKCAICGKHGDIVAISNTYYARAAISDLPFMELKIDDLKTICKHCLHTSPDTSGENFFHIGAAILPNGEIMEFK
jgi:hypothetical protein